MVSENTMRQYREQGWVVVEDLLDAAELARLRETVAGMVEGARGLTGHTDKYDLEPDHRPDAPRVRRIKTPDKFHPAFADLARASKLVAILQALLGTTSVRLQGSKINLKAPAGGAPVEWHQDWAFYPATNDDLLAIGVMLDDCTIENGAMLMLPGTHLGPVFDHHADGYFCGAIDPLAAGLDFSQAVPAVGRAGSVSFHHVRTVHGSAQNLSDKSRALLLYEFAAADAFPLSGVRDLAEFDSRLVSGEPTIMPRLVPVPVRMPLPPAPHQGSIYENQSSAKHRFFARKQAA
jgi:ectoine hydroxylase-related dioxygenase (phytanoyl-CoA dioxygenase family)